VVIAAQLATFLVLLAPFYHTAPRTTGGVIYAAGTIGFVLAGPLGCSISLGEGWSLMSLCSEVSDYNISKVLSGTDYRYVMKWNPDSQSFDIFSPRAASNPFTNFTLNDSYFINILASTIVYPSGSDPGDMAIALAGGWNSPSYPYRFAANVSRYFNSTTHRYLMKWNSSSQSFIIFSPRSTSTPFGTISRGEGQFLNSYSADTLVYNKSTLQ